MKKIKFLCLTVCFLMTLNICAGAKTISSAEDITDIDKPIVNTNAHLSIGADLKIGAKSAILMEPLTNTVLYEQNASELCAPASITKIMSLILIMEAIDQKKLSVEEVVTASERASKMGGSQIWLKENESMTVDDLLKAIVIASANDATVALAEHIAGSEEAFVALMNEKAKKLGMNSTTFKNSTGLDEEGHITSCYDVALMSSELIKHPLIKKYSTVWMDSLRNGESELVNTNKLVRFYEGTTGLKTGTTSKAGCCLSATATRNETELVAVIMCADSSAQRFSDAKKLLDFGFANYKLTEISSNVPENELIANVGDGTQKIIKGIPDGSVKLLLKKGEAEKIKQKVSITDALTAPIKKNEVIGTVDIYIENELAGKINIKAADSVEKLKFKVTFLWIIRGLFEL